MICPVLCTKKNRVSIEALTINLQLYKKREQSFIERVKKMIGYTDTGNCRSIYINQYFGDHSIKACGICDNCLKTKATGLTHDEFEKITRNIQSELSANKLTASDLLQKLKGTNKEKPGVF